MVRADFQTLCTVFAQFSRKAELNFDRADHCFGQRDFSSSKLAPAIRPGPFYFGQNP
jgi:hypothetical protein